MFIDTIRHGESVTNALRVNGYFAHNNIRFARMFDEYNPPLTETGIAQSRVLGIQWRAENPNIIPAAIYVSDMIRTALTAYYFCDGHWPEIPIQKTLLVRERLLRDGYYLTADEHRTLYPKSLEMYIKAGRYEGRPVQGQTHQELEVPVDIFVRMLQNKYSPKDRVLVFTHGGTMSAFEKILNNRSLEYMRDFKTPKNTAVMSYEI